MDKILNKIEYIDSIVTNEGEYVNILKKYASLDEANIIKMSVSGRFVIPIGYDGDYEYDYDDITSQYPNYDKERYNKIRIYVNYKDFYRTMRCFSWFYRFSDEKLKDKILKSVFHFISNQGDIQSKIMFKELLKRIEDSTSFLSSFIKEQERLGIKSRKPISIISELLAFNDNLYKLLQNEYSLIFPDFFKKKEEVISVRPENNISYKSDIFRNKEAEAWFYSMLEEFNVSNGERGFGAVIGGIFRNSNCKNHILKSHLKQKEYIQYLNERFNKKIDKEKLQFFIKILKYIFDNYDISKDSSEKDLLIANLLKENLNKNLEVYFENKKIDIFMYVNDISNILDKNIFLMNFLLANDVIKFINEKYNIYKENTSINEKEILTSIQNSINKDLELIKNTKLSERNFMKFFVLFNYFKQNSTIKNLLSNTRNLKDEIIHLTWNTEYSTGLITLSSLFFKVGKKEYMLFIHDIEKVKINNLSIEIETKSWKYTIPIFNSSEFSTEKEEAVKGLALYIKKLSKYWNDISKDLIIFVNNNFKEIDNLYSKPNFSLEFIFDLGLRAENIFKVFLKSGFVTEKDITLRINKLNSIANRLNKYEKQTDKIAVYPFDKKLIKDIQEASQDEFDKYINSEILAIYVEKVIENDYENPNDESIIVLTEKSLVIFTNSFGEVPLNIIENISIKGFATHTLVLKTTKGEFTCFMKTADDSNKIFIDLVKEYMSLIN